jgi:Ni,Fe-hydrogenase III large subunit/Ni,Fe-hydrogenase III component G
MNGTAVFRELETACGRTLLGVEQPYPDEVHAAVGPGDFKAVCLALHQRLRSPIASFFATDERKSGHGFILHCVFGNPDAGEWLFVETALDGGSPEYATLAKEIYSANLFEREMKEMFGLEPLDNPDVRRLNLHDEVWPDGCYPLRKDFLPPVIAANGEYRFRRIEGEGVYEVPVGPVHAGIIGPGHFRFSVAGEPVIHLEVRLGFTHRGVEKLFEGRTAQEAVALAECVSGDAAFAHSLSFCLAAEKLRGCAVPPDARYLRAVFLELERMYNHVADIGGIALDVGFSFPHAYASVMKETLHALNARLTGSRYLKGLNRIGGLTRGLDAEGRQLLIRAVEALSKDMGELKQMLADSVSFMDRVDTTGILSMKVAEDLGVTGVAARASGICRDLRQDFPGVYAEAGFAPVSRTSGDAAARLLVRIDEFETSVRLIKYFAARLGAGPLLSEEKAAVQGAALGYVEGWRGPVLYWLQAGADGRIERCKVTDASFHNWQGLAHAVPGNIIPDFPLCNKSFDLSYSGNDL